MYKTESPQEIGTSADSADQRSQTTAPTDIEDPVDECRLKAIEQIRANNPLWIIMPDEAQEMLIADVCMDSMDTTETEEQSDSHSVTLTTVTPHPSVPLYIAIDHYDEQNRSMSYKRIYGMSDMNTFSQMAHISENNKIASLGPYMLDDGTLIITRMGKDETEYLALDRLGNDITDAWKIFDLVTLFPESATFFPDRNTALTTEEAGEIKIHTLQNETIKNNLVAQFENHEGPVAARPTSSSGSQPDTIYISLLCWEDLCGQSIYALNMTTQDLALIDAAQGFVQMDVLPTQDQAVGVTATLTPITESPWNKPDPPYQLWLVNLIADTRTLLVDSSASVISYPVLTTDGTRVFFYEGNWDISRDKSVNGTVNDPILKYFDISTGTVVTVGEGLYLLMASTDGTIIVVTDKSYPLQSSYPWDNDERVWVSTIMDLNKGISTDVSLPLQRGDIVRSIDCGYPTRFVCQ